MEAKEDLKFGASLMLNAFILGKYGIPMESQLADLGSCQMRYLAKLEIMYTVKCSSFASIHLNLDPNNFLRPLPV